MNAVRPPVLHTRPGGAPRSPLEQPEPYPAPATPRRPRVIAGPSLDWVIKVLRAEGEQSARPGTTRPPSPDAPLENRIHTLWVADRRRLSREIHDRLGNTLSLAMRRLELAAARTPAGTMAIMEAVEVLSEALADLAEVTSDLRTERRVGSLRDSLAEFVRSVAPGAPKVDIRVSGSQCAVSDTVLGETFLILREGLRNAFAHARATHVSVDVDMTPCEIWGRVVDNGTGFDPTAVARAFGLSSMRERAEALRGAVAVDSRPGRGTQVALWIPLTIGTV